ncbi:MAG TPA: Gfo/Idh/MocA family oxidoreductase, partial [Bacteroidales bacterium]|nr:Gfo/Idh/MocA family oxidoreductase [Bacteroidales bacterium]
WNLEALLTIEKETGKKVFNILQVRLHPAIKALKKKIEKVSTGQILDVDLTYITARGNWYYRSWKGDPEKSGGIATNIGVHFFDLLTWIFGPVSKNTVHLLKPNKAAGFLQLEKARVRWFLSLEQEDIPANLRQTGARTFRSLTVEKDEIEFSDGFTELHTESFKEIIAGRGFGMLEAKPGIEIVHDIRVADPIGLKNDYHPILKTLKT